MPTGWSPAYASSILNTLNGTNLTAPTAQWAQLHTGDPGAAGTANLSAVTTRQQITETTSVLGSPLALSNTPAWSMTATETIGYISVWDAATGGTFLYSVPATFPQGVNNGDTAVLDDLDIVIGPVAA
jgi:hypothetical protein